MSVAAAPPRASWAEPPRGRSAMAAPHVGAEPRRAAEAAARPHRAAHADGAAAAVAAGLRPGLRAAAGDPDGRVPYLAYLTPGILAQSALFVSIFFGIQIIWDRDAGILTKVMVTPTPRAGDRRRRRRSRRACAGCRRWSWCSPVALLLGVGLTVNPLKILLAAVAIMLGAGFFACLSMAIAGLAGTRDRLMGFGQVITMPLFFASNALYPIDVMPTWLQVVSRINPLSYLVDALRGLLVGTPAHLGSTSRCSSAPPRSGIVGGRRAARWVAAGRGHGPVSARTAAATCGQRRTPRGVRAPAAHAPPLAPGVPSSAAASSGVAANSTNGRLEQQLRA